MRTNHLSKENWASHYDPCQHRMHGFPFHLSILASERWMPISMDSGADRCSFRRIAHAIAAIDSTPIRVMDPSAMVGGDYMDTQAPYPLSTGMLRCLATLAGGSYDKRALDDADTDSHFASALRLILWEFAKTSFTKFLSALGTADCKGMGPLLSLSSAGSMCAS